MIDKEEKYSFQEKSKFSPSGVGGTILVTCLLYTSDAADERSSVDLGGRRIIKKKNKLDISSSS